MYMTEDRDSGQEEFNSMNWSNRSTVMVAVLQHEIGVKAQSCALGIKIMGPVHKVLAALQLLNAVSTLSQSNTDKSCPPAGTISDPAKNCTLLADVLWVGEKDCAESKMPLLDSFKAILPASVYKNIHAAAPKDDFYSVYPTTMTSRQMKSSSDDFASIGFNAGRQWVSSTATCAGGPVWALMAVPVDNFRTDKKNVYANTNRLLKVTLTEASLEPCTPPGITRMFLDAWKMACCKFIKGLDAGHKCGHMMSPPMTPFVARAKALFDHWRAPPNSVVNSVVLPPSRGAQSALAREIEQNAHKKTLERLSKIIIGGDKASSSDEMTISDRWSMKRPRTILDDDEGDFSCDDGLQAAHVPAVSPPTCAPRASKKKRTLGVNFVSSSCANPAAASHGGLSAAMDAALAEEVKQPCARSVYSMPDNSDEDQVVTEDEEGNINADFEMSPPALTKENLETYDAITLCEDVANRVIAEASVACKTYTPGGKRVSARLEDSDIDSLFDEEDGEPAPIASPPASVFGGCASQYTAAPPPVEQQVEGSFADLMMVLVCTPVRQTAPRVLVADDTAVVGCLGSDYIMANAVKVVTLMRRGADLKSALMAVLRMAGCGAGVPPSAEDFVVHGDDCLAWGQLIAVLSVYIEMRIKWVMYPGKVQGTSGSDVLRSMVVTRAAVRPDYL